MILSQEEVKCPKVIPEIFARGNQHLTETKLTGLLLV